MKIKLDNNDRVLLRSVLISRKCELKDYMKDDTICMDETRKEFDRVCGLASLITSDCDIVLEYK